MKEIPFGRPMIDDTERNSVLEVLGGSVLTHGPMVKEFEERFADFCGAKFAVATASCTASLHLTWLALDLQPGEEVLVPAQTHTATAHAVEFCGAKAVFVDSEARTGNMDLDLAESLITDKTRALCVVHYMGVPVEMDKAVAICARHGIKLVEDCALAIGTKWNGTHAGLFGETGSFSFYPVKHITTGEGGMLITNDETLAGKLGRLRAFGIDRDIVSERKMPGMYQVQSLGYNYRLNEIGAAMGVQQMKKIGGFLKARKKNFEVLEKLTEEIDGCRLLGTEPPPAENSYYAAVVILEGDLADKRDDVVLGLKERGIGTSVYYPAPVPLMPYYSNKYGHREGDFPVASNISSAGITFPVGPHLEDGDIEIMVAALKESIASL